MKKTKILCTIGPATGTKEVLTDLVKAGMNIARLNFSHGEHDEKLEKINIIREINKELGTNVAILLDMKGPEIRTHKFENEKAFLKKGNTVKINMEEVMGTEEEFSITYSNLINDVDKGNSILVDDGLIELLVTGKEGTKIICQVLNDGYVKDKKGINVPNVELNFKYISEKDYSDVVFGCEHDVDFIGASFVRRKSDVEAIQEILKEKGKEKDIQIISKIENEEGVSNLEDIVTISDGIMVARGDLGVEVPMEEVPVIQKEMVKLCNKKHKPVIVATQMLDSMQENPRPTRAEVSDVTNAVIDGADAIMLSGETAVGAYPIRAVETMSKIAKYAEAHLNYQYYKKRAYVDCSKDYRSIIAMSAVDAAKDLDAKIILSSTTSGNSAEMLSIFRPSSNIIAATPSAKTARKLAIRFGVNPIVIPEVSSVEEFTDTVMPMVKEMVDLKTGDDIVITGGFTNNHDVPTNFMRFEKIK